MTYKWINYFFQQVYFRVAVPSTNGTYCVAKYGYITWARFIPSLLHGLIFVLNFLVVAIFYSHIEIVSRRAYKRQTVRNKAVLYWNCLLIHYIKFSNIRRKFGPKYVSRKHVWQDVISLECIIIIFQHDLKSR